MATHTGSNASPTGTNGKDAKPELSDSFQENQGKGGETHQVAQEDGAVLTTSQGVPVADDQNSLKQGARGPTLLEVMVDGTV